MEGLYTNRSTQGDFAFNAFSRYGRSCNVLIASAFFSSSETIFELLKQGCTIQLIVRLGPATSADDLKAILGLPDVQIRYFTDRSFHTKLYMFGSACALVGSANLTRAGISTNQEVVVSLGSDDPRFDDLVGLFVSYWDQAKVLTSEDLHCFAEVLRRNVSQSDDAIDSAVTSALGRHAFANINRGLPKSERKQEFVDAYRRRYQKFLNCWTVVYRAYQATGKRLTDPSFPLRIEIDQWFSFIRETHAIGDGYQTAPFLTTTQITDRIPALIDEFISTDWKWLTESVVPHSFPTIVSVLGTPEGIAGASEEKLLEALLCNHAFHDRFRFYDGGLPTMRQRFFEDNSLARIKAMLTHLLHGKPGDHVIRMADCIFNPKYQLQHFGEMCVQETYGWVNMENAPICNGRTLKSLRWLGFDIHVA